MKKISGGSLITKILFRNGINKAFCVPGESYLGILEAIRLYKKKFDLVVCRHEGGASYMAEAYGRLTKTPGICMVTRGPGACNAAIGVHTAYHEGSPMILFIGQVPVSSLNKNAFQAINPDKVFKSLSKFSATIKSPNQIYEIVEKAINISIDGKPGPVVITVPEEIQYAMVEDKEIQPYQHKSFKTNLKQISLCTNLLEKTENPIIILSGSKWKQSSKKYLEKFSKGNSIPIAVTFRKGDLFDNENKNFIGSIGVGPDPNLISYIKKSDLILLIGGEFGEIETNKFSQLIKASLKQKIYHVTDDQKLFQKNNFEIIRSDLDKFCEILNELKLKKNRNKSVYLIYKPTFDDLESLLRSTKTLIACHGAITHASNSFDVKKIDIIEKSKVSFYQRFTTHLLDYHTIYRSTFVDVESEIYNKILHS